MASRKQGGDSGGLDGGDVPARNSQQRRGRGRPRKDGTPAQPRDLDAEARKRVAKRHRDDCRRLAQAIESVGKLENHGAGPSGSPAQAVGTLTRATRDLHDLERTAYGMDKGSSGVRAVILLPVPADDMDSWAAAARTALRLPERVQDDPTARRDGYREIEADDVTDAGEGGA